MTRIPEWIWMILAIPTILSIIGGIALWMLEIVTRWRWKRRRRRGAVVIRLPAGDQIRGQADNDGGARLRDRKR